MKAKRLTALALAALMAASTTSVAFANEKKVKVEYDLDFEQGVYYKYDEDEGRIVKAESGYTFAPGEKIYVRVYEDDTNSSDKFSSPKIYNAYAEWDIGGSWVKDVNLVYKKGNIVTVPGSSVTKYKLQNLPEEYKALVGKEFTVPSGKTPLEAAKEYLLADSTVNQNAESAVDAANSAYRSEYYAVNGDATEYDSESAAKNAALANTQKANYYTVGANKYKEGNPDIAVGDQNGLVGTKPDGSKQYYNNETAKLQQYLLPHFGFSQYTGSDLYITGAIAASGTAVKDASNNTALTADGSVYTKEVNGTIYYVNTGVTQTAQTLQQAQIAVVAADNSVYYLQSTGAILTKATNQAYFNGDEFLSENENDAAEKMGYKGKVTEYHKADGTSLSDRAAAITEAKNDILKKFGNDIVKTETIKTPDTTEAQYEHWVEISTKSSNTTKDNDIVGTLYVGTNKNSAEKGDDDFRLDVTLSNQTNDSYDKGDYENAEDSVHIEPDTRAVVKFADDASDEFEVEFGDDALFIFNARGQGKLNLAYNTKYDKDFAYDYDDANIDFLTFEGEPTTNRTGTLYIYADEDSYIYEVTPRGAKKINGAKYNHDEEAWEIRTRHLTSYAISDKKLKTVDQMENSSSSNSSNKPGNNKPGSNKPGNNNDKPNPDTGR